MTISNGEIDNGHWNNSGDQLDYLRARGFVYVIYNTLNGMGYIGKKNFRINGKRNKGQQSAWRSYTSSSISVNEDIQNHGKKHFQFYILDQYYTTGGLSWAETWSQTVAEIPSNNHLWYNRFIDKCMWEVKEPPTEKHRRRLKKLIGGICCDIH